MHWAKVCQHKRPEAANIPELKNKTENNRENIIEEANIMLMTTADTKLQTDLNAIVDTGCTKTVAGEEWLNNYLKNLDDSLTNQVEANPSSRILKFGDGHKVTAISFIKNQHKLGEKTVLLSLKS